MRSVIRLFVGTCLVTILFGAPAAAQQGASSLRGSWSATIATRPALQGTWSAELQSTAPNAATGTWALVDAGGRIVARGTWSATRTSGTWSGAWSARASTDGRVRSGTWRADVERGPTTFAELLRSTLEKQLTGAWHSGGLQGAWALRANASDPKR